MNEFDHLVEAVIHQESRNNPRAVSPAGARGLMQIMPATARDPGFGVTPVDPDDLFDPEINRRIGTEYLGAMLKRYDGHLDAALAAYNWGAGNADKWVKAGKPMNRLPKETRGYLENITKDFKRRLKSGAGGTSTLPGGEENDRLGISTADAVREAVRRGLLSVESLKKEAVRRGLIPEPEPEPERMTTAEAINSAANRVQEAMTGGLMGDEYEAFMYAALRGRDDQTFWEEYYEQLQKRRAEDAQFKEENPIIAGAADVAGTVAGVGVLGAGQAVGGLGRRVGISAAEGMTMGAVDGFMRGEGQQDRISGAKAGAAGGAVVGGALPVAGAVVENVVTPIARVGANMLGLSSADRKAARMITGALDNDGALGATIRGKPDTLLEIGGDNTRRLAQTAYGVPNRAGAAAKEMAEQRVATQNNRITQDAQEYLGKSGVKFFRTVGDVIRKRKAQTTPMYNRLARKSTEQDGVLAGLMETPAMKQAMKKAAVTLDNMEKPVDMSAERLPFRFWDQTQKELHAMLKWSRSSLNSAEKAQSVGIQHVHNSLMDELYKRFSGYKNARAIFSDDSSILDAMEAGKNFLRGDGDEVLDTFQKMGIADKEAFRLGVARQLREIIEATPDTADAARKIMNREGIRDRLQAVTPGKGAFKAFLLRLGRESDYARTRNDVFGGSQTAYRRQAGDDFAAEAAVAGVEAATGGGGLAFLHAVKNGLIRRARGLDEKTANRIMEMISDNNVKGVVSFLRSDAGKRLTASTLERLPAPMRRAIVRQIAGQTGEVIGADLLSPQ
ncbi:MAG: lytic transglycosylase domain-containing protein [Pseudomonadota bacterium]